MQIFQSSSTFYYQSFNQSFHVSEANNIDMSWCSTTPYHSHAMKQIPIAHLNWEQHVLRMILPNRVPDKRTRIISRSCQTWCSHSLHDPIWNASCLSWNRHIIRRHPTYIMSKRRMKMWKLSTQQNCKMKKKSSDNRQQESPYKQNKSLVQVPFQETTDITWNVPIGNRAHVESFATTFILQYIIIATVPSNWRVIQLYSSCNNNKIS